jgi:hypothetical protein
MQTRIIDIHVTLQRLEKYIKEGGEMPEIKYWSGTESFSDYTGHYKADTLAESIDLYLDEHLYLDTENPDTAS